MQQKTDDLPADDETPRTVDVFLNFPTLGAGGQIQGVYPSKRFSALIGQVDGLDADRQGLAKLVGIVGIVDAVLTLIEESGLGTDVKLGSRGNACLGERRIRKNGNATGELARFEAGLVRFRNDRNCLIHAYLWKDNDDNSWRAMLDRNQSFLNELTGYFFEGRPTDTPGQIAFRFPQLYGLPPATM